MFTGGGGPRSGHWFLTVVLPSPSLRFQPEVFRPIEVHPGLADLVVR